MKARNEAHMSVEERLAVLETSVVNINSNLIDIKQETRHLSERIDDGFNSLRLEIRDLSKTMDKRFEASDRRFESMMTAMDKRFEAVDKRFEAMDKRFETIDKRFETNDKKFESMEDKFDRKFDKLADQLRFNLFWTITGFGTLLGVIARGLHWI